MPTLRLTQHTAADFGRDETLLALELTDERDRLGRGGCLAQLGFVALERFKEARSHKSDQRQLLLPVDDNYFCRYATA